MASIRKDIVRRSDQLDARAIDKGVKNCWSWNWLEKKVDGVYVREIIRKVNKPGIAYCSICCKDLLYGKQGFGALAHHIKSSKHMSNVKTMEDNFALPGTSQTAAEEKSNSTYGLHPMFSSAEISTETRVPRPLIPLIDRVANSEAMLLSFLAEKSLPFSLASDLLQLIKGMSHDKKALNRIAMHRTSAAYKLRFGVSKTIKENMVGDLKKGKFSMNIDESTSNNNEKVVTVLVNYLKDEKIVTEHLQSFSVDCVNSASLFKGIVSLMNDNGIPWKNLMSVLLDSCHVMRGKKSGLEVRLRENCPHLLDIDGDSCHHAHNAAKQFCKPFKQHLESLCADIHNDFKWSPDMRSMMKEICNTLNVRYTVPANYISFRWLSVYDVAQDLKRLFSAYMLFYFSFLKPSDKILFSDVVSQIYKEQKVNKPGRESIRKLQDRLSSKNLTAAGKERKLRITKKLFEMNLKTKLITNFYVSVLPLLKEYVKLFQSNEPLIHKLHDKQIELLRDFLTCFMKPEVLRCFGKSVKHLKSLDVGGKNNILPKKLIFVGDNVKQLIMSAPKSSEEVLSFRKLVVEAYIACSTTLLSKMPVDNNLLRRASAIDPTCRQHSISLKFLKELPQLVQNILLPQERETYDLEVHTFHSDTSLNFANEESIVKWWVGRKQRYPLMSRMALALLTCFHGPKVEASFSIMNNILRPGTSRLNISTLDALQTVKYHLLAEGKSSVDYFKKNDFLLDPVDRSLANNMRSSSKSYEKEKSEKKKEVDTKLRNLKDLKEKILSKEKAKKICYNAAKQQRKKHKKVTKIKLSQNKKNISEHLSSKNSNPLTDKELERETSKEKTHSEGKRKNLSEDLNDNCDSSKVIPKNSNQLVSNEQEKPPLKKRKTISYNIKEMFERAVNKKTGN